MYGLKDTQRLVSYETLNVARIAPYSSPCLVIFPFSATGLMLGFKPMTKFPGRSKAVAREAVAQGASFHGAQKIAINIKIANLKSTKYRNPYQDLSNTACITFGF